MICFLMTFNGLNAQQIDVKSVTPGYQYTLECNDLPQLTPISPNVPAPSYGFFWIFEDEGTFSFTTDPVHEFTGGNNHVTMEATPRYTPINKMPALECQIPNSVSPIVPASNPTNAVFPFNNYSTSINLQANRTPFFDHERTLVLSYENPTSQALCNTTITLFYNINQTDLVVANQVFNLENSPTGGVKVYNNETVQNPVVCSNGNFNRKIEIAVPAVQANTQHNIFFRFSTTILKGNVQFSANINTKCEGARINDTTTLEQPVYSAYDPNCITVDKEMVCYPDIFNYGERLTYTVRFQNEGDGPTQGVRVYLPFNNDLEMGSLVHKDSKFDYMLDLPIAITQPDVIWDFSNLGLPGSNQLGYECDQEASKGWFSFEVDSYREDYYAHNYGSEFELYNKAIIEFLGVSHMETVPAMTLFTKDCKPSDEHKSVMNEIIDNGLNANLEIEKVIKQPSGEVDVYVYNPQKEGFTLMMVSYTGNVIYNKTLNSSEDNVKINIPCGNFTSGVYIIKVSNMQHSVSKKFVL